MKKILIVIIILQSIFLYSIEENTTDIVKKKWKDKIIPSTKIFRIETATRLDTFNLYKTESYIDFMTESESTSLLYYDQAFFNNPQWNFFTYAEFPFYNIWLSNKSLWNGKIELKAEIEALILFMGNFEDIDDNNDTDETFFGHYVVPRFSFIINPVNKLFFETAYAGTVEIYHEDDNDGENNFVIKPTHYSNLISVEARYDSLEVNRGIYSKIESGFLVRLQDYYWGYDDEEKINQFSFEIGNVNFFRFAIKAINNSYFEFNIEEYYSYNDMITYGTQKLALDDNRYPELTLMNGYNEREFEFSKALKLRGLVNFNVCSKKYRVDESKKRFKNYYSNIINMHTYLIYNIMYFNDNIDNTYFFYDNNVINGFGTGYKISINPIFKRASHEFIISNDFNYGFDIYNHENRYDRFLITIGFLWSMLI